MVGKRQPNKQVNIPIRQNLIKSHYSGLIISNEKLTWKMKK